VKALAAFAFGHIQARLDPAHADLAHNEIVFWLDRSDPGPKDLGGGWMGHRAVHHLVFADWHPIHHQTPSEQHREGVPQGVTVSLDLGTTIPNSVRV